MRRPTLRITLDCNNACVFCAQRGLKASSAPSVEEQLKVIRERSSEVTLVGGEPTVSPELPEIIATARRLGFRGIGIQTNGRRLVERAYVVPLVQAGLTDVHLSIHGAEAAVHDYHVGVPGAFAQLMTGAHQARANGLTVVATTVLTRSNYRVILPLPQLLKARGIAAWVVALPRVAGALSPQEDRVTPRVGLAVPFALAALAEAAKIGLEAWIQGAPACSLGPYVSRLLPDDARSYAPVCESCPSRSFCPGVDPAYLEQFKGDELSAKAMPAPTKPTPITRLFVGVGELAPSIVPERPAPDVQVTPLGVGKPS